MGRTGMWRGGHPSRTSIGFLPVPIPRNAACISKVSEAGFRLSALYANPILDSIGVRFEMGATTSQSQSRQHHSKPGRDDFGRFQGLRDGEPLFTPRLESAFQHPYLVDAYALQCDGDARA